MEVRFDPSAKLAFWWTLRFAGELFLWHCTPLPQWGLDVMSESHCTNPTGGCSFAQNIKNLPDAGVYGRGPYHFGGVKVIFQLLVSVARFLSGILGCSWLFLVGAILSSNFLFVFLVSPIRWASQVRSPHLIGVLNFLPLVW